MSRGRVFAAGLVSAGLVLIADQLSKWWVLDILRLPLRGRVDLLPVLSLTMVWNRGITFGLLHELGAWASPLLVATAVAIVLALGAWMYRAERLLVVIALGGIVGGAIGNVIDRLRFGAVADFIHAHAFGYSWYVFNIADAAIVCGVALLVLDTAMVRTTEAGHGKDNSRRRLHPP
ncbi:MAG: signal peptidase II [Acetobacteraceae bacterium]|nr:signal peptidase II [Acetobacteraceae bacterium]